MPSVDEARVMLSMTLWLLTALVPLQIVLGDQHGLNTREHQPAKLAAIEARWDTDRGVPLTLFAIPDAANETNRSAIATVDLPTPPGPTSVSSGGSEDCSQISSKTSPRPIGRPNSAGRPCAGGG